MSAVPGGEADRAATDDDAVVVVDLAGVEGDSRTRIESLPGVLSCSEAGHGAPGDLRATVRVTAGLSDDVLRQVLSWPPC